MRAAGGIKSVDGGSTARMGRMTIHELLARARSGLCRMCAVQVLALMRSGAAAIDIRFDSLMARDRTIAGRS
jgi:hypothetical protein